MDRLRKSACTCPDRVGLLKRQLAAAERALERTNVEIWQLTTALQLQAERSKRSPVRNRILSALDAHGSMRTQDIARHIGRRLTAGDSLYYVLRRMCDAGEIRRVGHGRYALSSTAPR